MSEDSKPQTGDEDVAPVQGEAVAQTSQVIENGSSGACMIDGALDPAAIVIFGASGDLTGRKLIPALYNLYCIECLPDPFLILGTARSEYSDESWREKMHQAVIKHGGLDLSQWGDFATRLHYQPLVYDHAHSYHELADRLQELEHDHSATGNRMFNLAIPPALYATVASMIGRAGLAREKGEDGPWRRLVVEKPFGRDLASARELDQAIAVGFAEHQVFRIDHYLAKETVQNVLMMRFANSIFEPIWNRNYIDHVTIIAAESLGVEHRAGYYEQAGVLRDMFQNHMIQLLALSAVEPPTRYGADRVRDEKVKLARAVRPYTTQGQRDYLVLGQYQAGEIAGEPVIGYRQEPGVAPDSVTPTFGMLKVEIENWRWQGVPFYLISGKRLAKKATRVGIHFKEVPHSLFRSELGEHISTNRLILGIHPDESISLTIQTKNPGARLCLRTVKMLFDYNQGYSGPILEAYEKALLDCILGDQMLFWRRDGVEISWALLDPVLEACETCADRGERLKPYPAGSWGPKEVERLLPSWPKEAQ